MITFDSKNKIFHLFNNDFSYYFGINPLGYLIHLYYGKYLSEIINVERINERYIERYAFLDKENKEICDENYYFSLLGSNFECATNLTADTRGAHTIFEHSDGSLLTDFRFERFKIIKGKENPEGLPHVLLNKSGECETLVVTLKDKFENVYLELHYSVFENLPIIIRRSRLLNKSGRDIKIKRISSLELDMPNDNYEILSLHGEWSDDRELETTKINHQKIIIEDNRGSRGFKANPSVMIKNKDTTFDSGEVFGISLIYSGSFKIETGLDEIDNVRTFALINDDNFYYTIKNNEIFDTPECIQVYSSKGINGVTQSFHDLARNNIIPRRLAQKERPVLINSWEAYHFDFDTNKIKKFIKEAKDLGIELVVLDDGWFGKRNDDSSSLGDWKVNLEKINLKEVIDYAHSLKMKFGLWIEPEMISPNSELFKKYPSFAMFNRKTEPTLLRHQLVLDLTNKEVIDYVFNEIASIFDNYEIDYCKWDFNRFLSEVGTYGNKINEGEIYHRFILGTYELLNRFKNRYPEILLETCASGGGRFDFGMLYYSPQIWCSDETNPYSRATLQYATNMFYPLSSIGSHVSESEALSIQDKAIVAAFGTFGYELDILKLSDKEKEEIKNITKLIKDWHFVVTSGDYYALSSPYESNFSSWNVVTKDKKVCLVFNFGYKRVPTKTRFLKIKGLDKNKYYFNSLTNDVYKGEFYMNVGLNLSAPLKEGMTMLFVLKEVNVIIKTIVNKKAKAQKREKLL